MEQEQPRKSDTKVSIIKLYCENIETFQRRKKLGLLKNSNDAKKLVKPIRKFKFENVYKHKIHINAVLSDGRFQTNNHSTTNSKRQSHREQVHGVKWPLKINQNNNYIK